MSQQTEVESSQEFASPLRETGLTADEKNIISAVDKRAKRDSIDNKLKMRATEGYLQKWTNLMKGYQRRYLYLDPSTGILQYYISKDQISQPARGWLSISSAVIANIPDDPMGFEVIAANGDTYKLRASSPTERQDWISALKCTIDLNAVDNKFLSNSIRGRKQSQPLNPGTFNAQHSSQDPAQERRVVESVMNMEKLHGNLSALLSTPELGPQSPLYKDVLVLKSLSNSAIESVYKCAHHIQQPPVTPKTVLSKKNSSNSLVALFDSSLGNMHF